MKKNANYEIKYDINTIIVTKKFLKEASVMGTPEFEEYMELRRRFPAFTTQERKIKKSKEKETYKNLTIVNMGKFIEITVNENDREEKLEQFKTMKELSQIQPAPYAYLKSWFLSEYGLAYRKKYEEQKADSTEANTQNNEQ